MSIQQFKEDPARSVARELEAAKNLIAIIVDEGMGDDDELVVDSIEGETDLFEAIGRALDDIDQCETMLIGLKEKKLQFGHRETKVKGRVERLKAAIEQAMMICELDKLPLPTATLSLRAVPAGFEVVEEAEIPSKYFKKKPVLDKQLLIADSKARFEAGEEPLPGVLRTNGSRTLAIRRK